MLLGAWADPGDAPRILDIGTGCGVLALMIAQRSEALIDAIDIDQSSVNQAMENFRKSLWSGRLNVFCKSLDFFQSNSSDSYDYIISNPPFFKNQLRSVSGKVNITKHDEGLNAEILIKAINLLLNADGKFSVIFPYHDHVDFINICTVTGFRLVKRTTVSPKPGIRPNRTLMEFSRSFSGSPLMTDLCIMDSNGSFSGDYLKLTAEYHSF